MAIYDVFARLYRASITLTPADGDRIEAEGPLTDELRQLVRTHKTELRAELIRQKIGQIDDYPSSVPRRYVIPPYCRVKDTCHRLGSCGPPGTLAICGTLDLTSKEPSNENDERNE